MPARKPLKVQSVGSPLSLRRHDMFPLADRAATAILVDTVTNAASTEQVDDALYALMKESRYYTKGCESDPARGGDLMNACYDAGLMLGLAFGLRLRGAV